MNIKLTTITPDMAADLLTKNRANRKLNLRHVDFLANQIRTGKWQNNGQTIVVASDGTLMDGQHRLSAIIAANEPAELGLVTDVSRNAMATIDNGKPRSSTDVLSMINCKQPSLVASGIHLLFKFDHGDLAHTRLRMPNSVVGAALDQITLKVDLDWLCNITKKTSRNTRIKKSNLFAALYLIATKYGQKAASDFIEKINNGGDYPKSPTSMMPQIVARIKAQGKMAHRCHDLMLVLAGFERWILHKEMTQYRQSKILRDIDKFTKTYNTQINW